MALRSLAAQARARAPRCPRCWRGPVNPASRYGWCQPCEREHDERLAAGEGPAPIDALLGPPPLPALAAPAEPADFDDDRDGPELLAAAGAVLLRLGRRLTAAGWQTCGRCQHGRAPLGAQTALCQVCRDAAEARIRASKRRSYHRMRERSRGDAGELVAV